MQVFKSFFKVLRKYIGQMIMYVGILRSGETRSEIFPELQIVPLWSHGCVHQCGKHRSTELL